MIPSARLLLGIIMHHVRLGRRRGAGRKRRERHGAVGVDLRDDRRIGGCGVLAKDHDVADLRTGAGRCGGHGCFLRKRMSDVRCQRSELEGHIDVFLTSDICHLKYAPRLLRSAKNRRPANSYSISWCLSRAKLESAWLTSTSHGRSLCVTRLLM